MIGRKHVSTKKHLKNIVIIDLEYASKENQVCKKETYTSLVEYAIGHENPFHSHPSLVEEGYPPLLP